WESGGGGASRPAPGTATAPVRAWPGPPGAPPRGPRAWGSSTTAHGKTVRFEQALSRIPRPRSHTW
ncbi:hypothetical protein ACFXPY_38945, partial [Streptomyces sp. NPDC059153]|uniref:hypothetical protein n=1 Tax=Streptomyces sp. NPDC059153 TaxID=3346743 RepID=UPI0036C07193